MRTAKLLTVNVIPDENQSIKEEAVGGALWLIAVVVAIVGLVQLFQGQVLLGIILLVAAAAIGPGGFSLFRSRRT